MKYARVGGLEYGAHVVRTERPAPTPTLSVYPNPASSSATVEVGQRGRLEVFDIMGRRVQAVDVSEPGRVTLQLAGYASGVYLLRLGKQVCSFVVE